MNEVLTLVGLLALGAVFLYATHLAYRKDWKVGAYIALAVAAFFFVMALPATRDLLRSAVWGAFITSLESTGQGLVRLNRTIDGVLERIEQEQARRQTQQEALDKVQAQLLLSQQEIADAQDRIEKQQSTLEDLRLVVQQTFKSIKTEHFSYKEGASERVRIIALSPTSSAVIFALNAEPIQESIRLQIGVNTAPPGSFELLHNVVLLASDPPAPQMERSIASYGASIQYVPDPFSEREVFPLEVRGDEVLTGDVVIFDGSKINWPSGRDPWAVEE